MRVILRVLLYVRTPYKKMQGTDILATAPRATYAAVSYVANDTCEHATSERQKKCGKELGQHVVFSLEIPRNCYECLGVFGCGTW